MGMVTAFVVGAALGMLAGWLVSMNNLKKAREYHAQAEALHAKSRALWRRFHD